MYPNHISLSWKIGFMWRGVFTCTHSFCYWDRIVSGSSYESCNCGSTENIDFITRATEANVTVVFPAALHSLVAAASRVIYLLRARGKKRHVGNPERSVCFQRLTKELLLWALQSREYGAIPDYLYAPTDATDRLWKHLHLLWQVLMTLLSITHQHVTSVQTNFYQHLCHQEQSLHQLKTFSLNHLLLRVTLHQDSRGLPSWSCLLKKKKKRNTPEEHKR